MAACDDSVALEELSDDARDGRLAGTWVAVKDEVEGLMIRWQARGATLGLDIEKRVESP
jgi:hypothetical protein